MLALCACIMVVSYITAKWYSHALREIEGYKTPIIWEERINSLGQKYWWPKDSANKEVSECETNNLSAEKKNIFKTLDFSKIGRIFAVRTKFKYEVISFDYLITAIRRSFVWSLFASHKDLVRTFPDRLRLFLFNGHKTMRTKSKQSKDIIKDDSPLTQAERNAASSNAEGMYTTGKASKCLSILVSSKTSVNEKAEAVIYLNHFLKVVDDIVLAIDELSKSSEPLKKGNCAYRETPPKTN